MTRKPGGMFSTASRARIAETPSPRANSSWTTSRPARHSGKKSPRRKASAGSTRAPATTMRPRAGVSRRERKRERGAVGPDAPWSLALLPGTHSKWAIVRSGAIQTFATYMTGEVYAVLREHSILGRMAEGSGRAFADAAFRRGVQRALTKTSSAD